MAGGSTKNLGDVLAALNEFKRRAMLSLATKITRNLKRATRVDTGWARANWQISPGAPATETIADEQSQAQAIRALSSYDPGKDGPVYISNRVPYVGLITKDRGALSLPEVGKVVSDTLDKEMGLDSGIAQEFGAFTTEEKK